MMNYKGYIGHVEYDDENKIFTGEVINTHSVITFHGSTVAELAYIVVEKLEISTTCGFVGVAWKRKRGCISIESINLEISSHTNPKNFKNLSKNLTKSVAIQPRLLYTLKAC